MKTLLVPFRRLPVGSCPRPYGVCPYRAAALALPMNHGVESVVNAMLPYDSEIDGVGAERARCARLMEAFDEVNHRFCCESPYLASQRQAHMGGGIRAETARYTRRWNESWIVDADRLDGLSAYFDSRRPIVVGSLSHRQRGECVAPLILIAAK